MFFGEVALSARVCSLGLAVAFVIAASCGNGNDPLGEEAAGTQSGLGAEAEQSQTSTSPAASSTTTAAPQETPKDDWLQIPWETHVLSEDCMCADGSEYWIRTRIADPTKVVVFLSGGGACWDAATCDPETGVTSVRSLAPETDPPASVDSGTASSEDGAELAAEDEESSEGAGIFDFDNPANPLRGWSFVSVPYCTADIFLGDKRTDYGGLVLEHRGLRNATAALDHVIDNFGDVETLLIAGGSGGGAVTPLLAGLAADRLGPDVDLMALADSAGAFGSLPPLFNLWLDQVWGTTNNVPDWSSTTAVESAEDWDIPRLFDYAGREHPSIRMGRFDFVDDRVQRFYKDIYGAERLAELFDANETLAEAGGVELNIYLAPGEGHEILIYDEMYSLGSGSESFLDWFTSFLNGDDVSDIRCQNC